MKKIIKIYVRFVQGILVTIFLTILYFFGFSITKLFLIIFPNKYYKRKLKGNTYWEKAEGYEPDMDAAAVQS